jgi:hypothetical protein
MDEKRELEILRAYVSFLIRKNFSLHQIANAKRDIGNIIREPELTAIKVTEKEALYLQGRYLSEVFNSQMRKGDLPRTTYI